MLKYRQCVGFYTFCCCCFWSILISIHFPYIYYALQGKHLSYTGLEQHIRKSSFGGTVSLNGAAEGGSKTHVACLTAVIATFSFVSAVVLINSVQRWLNKPLIDDFNAEK